MTHTLAAVFEERADADKASEELVAAGFARESIQLNDSISAVNAAQRTDAGTRDDGDESILGSIKHMFSQLLGREHDDRDVYAEAVNRGHVVLTVRTNSTDDADRAADIIDDFGPLDIDEQETQWRASGWTGADTIRSGVLGAQQGGLGMQQSAPEPHGIRPREEAVELARSAQGMLGEGSLQRAGADTSVPGSGAVPLERQPVLRSGMRIYPNQDSLNILRGDDGDDGNEVYFRSHWQNTLSYTGGTYQEYEPAYLYGESMAGSQTYRDKPWEHAEADLRSTWESTHPQSSWDKFKDAVREGWDRVTK
jgi:hypothetical protein